MMDAAEEIPQLVRPEKKPREDGETPLCSLTQAVAMTKVLDDDNLLREIIVRVGFPTTLVRAALVCKRWLGHASDPKFLSCFRKLHPPRLLGYYVTMRSLLFQWIDAPCFVPMLPQPPELAAAIRRLESYNFGDHEISDCRNGTVFTLHCEGRRWTHGVHHPLCAETNMQIIPPLPRVQEHDILFSQMISNEEGSSMYYLYVLGVATETGNYTSHVYMLQGGEWLMRTSATWPHGMRLYPIAKHIGHNKIYLPSATSDDIIVLDLMDSSFSTIQLPQGVKYSYLESMLSRADDASSVYLFDVKGFQLRIWLHKGNNWLLIDTICLLEMLSTLGMPGHRLENEGIADVLIRQVGGNGQFVILQMCECMFSLDIKCRTLCKVYENTITGRRVVSVDPFMMIWPPIFPAIRDDPARKLSDGRSPSRKSRELCPR